MSYWARVKIKRGACSEPTKNINKNRKEHFFVKLMMSWGNIGEMVGVLSETLHGPISFHAPGPAAWASSPVIYFYFEGLN